MRQRPRASPRLGYRKLTGRTSVLDASGVHGTVDCVWRLKTLASWLPLNFPFPFFSRMPRPNRNLDSFSFCIFKYCCCCCGRLSDDSFSLGRLGCASFSDSSNCFLCGKGIQHLSPPRPCLFLSPYQASLVPCNGLLPSSFQRKSIARHQVAFDLIRVIEGAFLRSNCFCQF